MQMLRDFQVISSLSSLEYSIGICCRPCISINFRISIILFSLDFGSRTTLMISSIGRIVRSTCSGLGSWMFGQWINLISLSHSKCRSLWWNWFNLSQVMMMKQHQPRPQWLERYVVWIYHWFFSFWPPFWFGEFLWEEIVTGWIQVAMLGSHSKY